MKLATAIVAICFALLASPAGALEGNGNDGGGPPVTTNDNEIKVVAQNDGGELVIEVNGDPCTYRKLTLIEVAAIPGGNFPIPPNQRGNFVEREEPDGTISYMYLRTCHDDAGVPVLSYHWIAEAAPDDIIGAARQELIEIAPAPNAMFSPGSNVNQLVGLPTFVWLDGAALQDIVVTAQVPGLAVTATATPTRLLLDAGDGSSPVDCDLTTAEYAEGADPEDNCTHTYERVSTISPTGLWPFRVAVEWTVTWVNSLGAAGTVLPIETESIYPLTVVELQPRTTNG